MRQNCNSLRFGGFLRILSLFLAILRTEKIPLKKIFEQTLSDVNFEVRNWKLVEIVEIFLKFEFFSNLSFLTILI